MAWGWLKKLGRGVQAVAPVALMFTPPPFNAVAQVVYGAVLRAEKNIQGEKRGADRLTAAMQELEFSAPLIMREIERISGKEIVDDKAFEEAMESLIAFQVKITKSVGDKPE